MKAESTILIAVVRLIKELALEYDKEWGSYPENQYEGLSFYQFVCNKLGMKPEELEKLYPEIYPPHRMYK